jgi:hypothetical protein
MKPDRVVDARTILDAGLESEAMGLILDDLAGLGEPLPPSQVLLVKNAARTLGLTGDPAVQKITNQTARG